jgi:hypothetical protein
VEAGDRSVGSLDYPAELFDRATFERWGSGLRAMLTAMVRDRDTVNRTPPLPGPA